MIQSSARRSSHDTREQLAPHTVERVGRLALLRQAFADWPEDGGYFFRAVTTNMRSISSRGASYSMRLLMPQTPRSPHL